MAISLRFHKPRCRPHYFPNTAKANPYRLFEKTFQPGFFQLDGHNEPEQYVAKVEVRCFCAFANSVKAQIIAEPESLPLVRRTTQYCLPPVSGMPALSEPPATVQHTAWGRSVNCQLRSALPGAPPASS